MPPVIVVEDGTVVTGANSFVLLATVTAYAVNRGDTDWSELDLDVQKAAVIKAADYLRNETRLRYLGTRKVYNQRMPYPRVGVSERRGLAIPDDAIPWRLQDAQCELALRIGAGIDVQPDLERGGMITNEKVDVLSTSYSDHAPVETLFQAVMGLLEPLLAPDPSENPMPFLAVAADETAFAENVFHNPEAASPFSSE